MVLAGQTASDSAPLKSGNYASIFGTEYSAVWVNFRLTIDGRATTHSQVPKYQQE